MPTSGRIEVDGADVGSGFALEPRLVVTARHLLGVLDTTQLRYVPEPGAAPISIDDVAEEPALDIAVLRLADDVAVGLRFAQPVAGARFEVDAQPRPNDPLLRGFIDSTQWQVIPHGGTVATTVLQLGLDRSLGDYHGFSGAAVSSPPGVAVGVLIEQVPERVRTRQASRAAPYLYAVPIDAVLERFGDSSLLDAGHVDGRAFPTSVTSARASLSPPPPSEVFVAREEELKTLRERWQASGAPAVLLHGLPGAGKSALAAAAARDAGERFSDGVLYFDLKGLDDTAVSVQEVFDQLFGALGVPEAQRPADVGQRRALLDSLLENKRFLLVLDDARNEEQVRPLLLRGEGCGTLVTSRSTLPAIGEFQRTEVEAFSERVALGLLERLVGPDRIINEMQHAKRMNALCGGLPLALRITGGRLATRTDWSIEQYANALQDEKRRLEGLQLGDLDVRASIMLSYRLLSEDEQHTLRVLGILRSATFEADAASAAAGGEPAKRHLDGMVDAGLLSPRPGRLALHELVRVFAREQLDDAERETALERIGTHYAERAAYYTAQLEGGGAEAPQALRWTVLERPNLDELPEALVEIGQDALCVRLVLELGPLYAPLYAWSAWEHVVTCGVEAAQREGDPDGEMRLQHNRAIAFAHLGHSKDAKLLYESVLGKARDAGDQVLEARVLAQMGTLQKGLGHPDEAARLLALSISAYQAAGDDLGEARALGDLANCLDDLGQHEEALARHRDAIARFRTLEDVQGESLEYGNAGIALHRLGRLDDAEEAYRAAAEGFEHLGASVPAATAKRRIAEAIWLKGRIDEAERLFGEVLEVLQDAGAVYETAEAFATREACLARDGRTAEALHDSLRAAECFARAGDVHAQAVEVARTGALYLEMGDEGQGLEACVQAERLFQGSGNRPDVARAVALTERAPRACKDGSLQEAYSLWRQAADTYAAVGHAEEGVLALGVGAAMLEDAGAEEFAERSRLQADAVVEKARSQAFVQVELQGTVPSGRRAQLTAWVASAARDLDVCRPIVVEVGALDRRWPGASMRIQDARLQLSPALFEEAGSRGHFRLGWHVYVMLAGQELMRRGVESDGGIGSMFVDLVGEWFAVGVFGVDGTPPFRSSLPPASPHDASRLGAAIGAALAGSALHRQEVDEWLAHHPASPYVDTARRLLSRLGDATSVAQLLGILEDEYRRRA